MELILSPLGAALLAALAVFAIALASRPDRSSKKIVEQMGTWRQDASRHVNAPQVEGSFIERAVLPLGHGIIRRLGRLLPATMVEEIQGRLNLAGRPGSLTGTDFLGVRVLVAVIGLVLGLMIGGRLSPEPRVKLLAPLLLALVGFIAPNYWLNGRIRKRRADIQRALPDALDMLNICVEAGLAFESALQRVSNQWSGPLSREFGRVVAEIRLGVPRAQALRRLAQRCDVPDVSSFVAVLVQADSMGTGIAQVLRSQADQIRVLRRQRAEESANKAPIKVIMVMMMFIFPALFVVILGPAVPKVLSAFSGM